MVRKVRAKRDSVADRLPTDRTSLVIEYRSMVLIAVNVSEAQLSASV